jgi:hypothetical protein
VSGVSSEGLSSGTLCCIDTKMVEYEVDEDKVIEHIDVINVTKREIELVSF